MQNSAVFSILWVVFMGSIDGWAQTDELTEIDLADAYPSTVFPLLERYCIDCHEGEEAEAEIDLASFLTIADVRKSLSAWQKVSEMLGSRQMPPKKADQPNDDERDRILEWVLQFLTTEAEAGAGDPGPVVLRRLNSAEYTYTVRDLTGVESLDPAREFPVDGAAGEGFINTGDALGMSPSLVQKYLDASKRIAAHAVLLSDGIRFSPHTTQRDRTDDLLARIREFYGEFTDSGGGSAVNLQGIEFETNQGGLLPLDRYLMATLSEWEALIGGDTTVDKVAHERRLNAKYLDRLWQMLSPESSHPSSLLLDRIRTRWRTASVAELPSLIEEIRRWQATLWKLNSIGHIGRAGGPKGWLEPVSPLDAERRFELRLSPPADGGDVAIYLSAFDAGDGHENDHVIWKNPRLVGEGRSDLSLRYLIGLGENLVASRQGLLAKTTEYLAAAAAQMDHEVTLAELAQVHDLEAKWLGIWLDYLEIAVPGPVEVTGHFKEKRLKGGGYDFINGWGSGEPPSITANSSETEVRIPGTARPHSIMLHPSPTRFAAVAWRSPIDGSVSVEAQVTDAHPECGNGIEWIVQYRSGSKVKELWDGEISGGQTAEMLSKTIDVRRGELVSLLVGPRDENHGCDLTEINLVIGETAGKQVWDLAEDVSGDILASNPHSDGLGNEDVWHFYHGEMKAALQGRTQPFRVPNDSLLARWKNEDDPVRREALAQQLQRLVQGEAPVIEGSADAVVFQHIHAFPIPLDLPGLFEDLKSDPRFGTHPLGEPVDPGDLVTQAPSVLEFWVPAELAEGRDVVVVGQLEPRRGHEGSVQIQVSTSKPKHTGLRSDRPITIAKGSQTEMRLESDFDAFRQLFPPALCYTKIVPVDEVVTLTLFYREDDQLKRLMLDDEQVARLDQLWAELLHVSREPLRLEVAYEQITEFATQDRPDLVEAWKPFRQPVLDRAAAFRRHLVEIEPVHVDAVLEIADRAWRRPLKIVEQHRLRALYHQLRAEEVPHDRAIRLVLARVLSSPAFLYRLEHPGPGNDSIPVSDLELATRLSYFLWASAPDVELREVAEAGLLSKESVLMEQTRRMLADPRTRRMAIEFACQWLHIRDFDQTVEKNERLYPDFARLRVDMYEESVRFFEEMFRRNGSVLDLLDSDHTYLNETLANHYGVEGVTGPEWRRVNAVRDRGRGGILAMASFLSTQSGVSRTSPILRGNWVSETLLGERLPRPPANVPVLPDEPPDGLTERELIERHSSEPGCAKCHARIDPYGFALEQYDAIGRRRTITVDTQTQLIDGKKLEGIAGLRDYLLTDRHDDFLEQFSRKLLGYALGRSVQLSDRPLLKSMQRDLEANDYRFNVAVEAVVTSRQFREIRGERMATDE